MLIVSYVPTFQIRLNYHLHSATMTPPGPLELYVKYVNDTSGDNGFVTQLLLTKVRPMRISVKGWQRWEAALPVMPQLR